MPRTYQNADLKALFAALLRNNVLLFCDFLLVEVLQNPVQEGIAEVTLIVTIIAMSARALHVRVCPITSFHVVSAFFCPAFQTELFSQSTCALH
uniref:Uncharacterized protein n=1 Tax=Steinernema glaseri TaxID=37863 RepID=A0A1I7ZA08_9BILA